MSESVRRLLVAYDISSDKRRDKVAVALQSYGERVQYSVFVVDGKPADFVRMRSALGKLIEESEDRILICDLGSREAAKERVSYLGREVSLTGDSSALIV
jgi:CRISPR-associated protein Cas2